MKKNIEVVIITINYNQSKMTLECVHSILKSSFKDFKLIVVDNGSDDKEYKLLTNNINPDVLVERIDENCGYVGGVNKGLFKASRIEPTYFMIMNNDTIIDKDAVQFLVDAAKKYSDRAIISGKVFHYDEPNVIQYIGSHFSDRRFLKEVYLGKDEFDMGQFDQEEERDMLDDIFWVLPKKIFKDIGYYSDKFFLYAEQADYALRAVKKGYKLIYTPKAKIWHKGSLTTGGGHMYVPSVNFWRKKSSVIYLYRNTKKRYFYLVLVKIFPKILIKNILNFFNLRKGKDKRSEYAALVGIIYGIKWILNQKPDNGYNPFL